jgi:hypothetical protein
MMIFSSSGGGRSLRWMTIPMWGLIFRGDPDMPLPPGVTYSDIGNKFLNISFFFVFLYLRNKNIFGMVFEY